MKRATGCAFLLFFFLLLGGFAAIFFLNQVRPKELDVPPVPKPDPDLYLKWVGMQHEFRRTETSDHFNVTYGFIDYHGKKHRISCDIPREGYEKERKNFGYVEKELDEAIDQYLQKYINKEIKTRGIASYMKVRFQGGGGYRWEWSLPGDLEEQEKKRAQKEIDRIVEILKSEAREKVTEIATTLYQERGFRFEKNEIKIDYKKLALQSEPELAGCFDAIHDSGRGYSERQYIGLYLAFLQEIRYEVPPLREDGKFIQGLWVPTEVVVNNHGDCDSKSVTYAAFCKKMGVPVIVIRIPGHVLVGVESTPGPGQEFVRIGNRYFVLCEPAGPGKLYPGNEGRNDISGNFEYVLIEPNPS